MQQSHAFDLLASPAFRALEKLVRERFALSAAEAAAQQPVFERCLREGTAALERAVHTADFSRLDMEVEGVVVEGKRYRRRAEKTVGRYDTMAGPIELERSVYRRRGGHGGETICPLEMRLGLVGGRWTLAAAEVGSRFMTSVPSKEAVQLLASVGGMQPSAAHLDRLPKAVSAVWEANRERFEAAVQEAAAKRLPAVDLVVLILVSLDGVMVPMKDAPRTPGAGKQDSGPKGHREASCATLSLFDELGNRLHTIRFARMPESKKVTLQAQITREFAVLLERYPNAKLQGVADGAKENWRILGEVAGEFGREVKWVLDYFHAAEHINDALRRHAGKDREQATWDIRYWKEVLRDDPKGVHKVLRALKYRVGKAKGKKRDDILKELNYVDRHKHMMNYAELREQRRPIGSGIQEAACKTLATQRMKRSGMSWLEPGGQAILTLRSLEQSDRTADAWNVLRPAFRKHFDVDKDLGRLELQYKVA